MKRVIAGILTFSLIFECMHFSAYATDYPLQDNENDSLEVSLEEGTNETIDPAENIKEIGEDVKAPTDVSENVSSVETSSNTSTGIDNNAESDNTESEIYITRQSEDAVVYIGETVNFFVETTAVKPKYDWSISKDNGDTWQKCGYNGFKTNCLSFPVQTYQYGYKFKCSIKDENGQEAISDVFTIYEKPSKIVDQSDTVHANIGDTASLNVQAEGNKLSYRWYYSKDNGASWIKVMNYTLTDALGNKTVVPYEGYKENSLSFTVTKEHFDYLFKCVITDMSGAILETGSISLIANGSSFSEQPVDQYLLIGEKAVFHASYMSAASKYEWLISKDNGATWQKCGYNGSKTDTLSFDVQSYQYGYLFKCRVTDNSGQTYLSDQCGLYEKETLLKTPKAVIEAEKGENVDLEVEAEGNKLTYRWYYSTDSGKTWIKCMNYTCVDDNGTKSSKAYEGYLTNKLSFLAQDVHANMLFRCNVTDRSGKVYYSDNISVKLKHSDLRITKQPRDVYGLLNDTATINVKAEGINLKYLWYISKNNGSTWSVSGYNGYKTSTVSFPIQSYQYGYMFYCEIQNNQGEKIISDKITIYEKDTCITDQSKDVSCELGNNVELFVKAEGNKLSYLWSRSKDGGVTWETCPKDLYNGTTSDKLSFTSTKDNVKYLYRCTVTDRRKINTYSDAIKIEIKDPDKLISLNNMDYKSDNSLTGLKKVLDKEYTNSNAVIAESGKTASIVLTPSKSVTDSDVFLVHFFAKSDYKNSTISVKVNNSKYIGNFSAPVYISEFILPVKGIDKIDKLTIETTDIGQKVHIYDLDILSTGGKDLSQFNLGTFDRDETYRNDIVSEDTAIGFQAVDLLSDGKYLYSLGRGELVIYEIGAGGPKVIGAVNGLGNAREMVFCNNKNGIVVSSRESGIFTVDITDKTKPRITCELPSQGLSTGLCVQDNYCFVASRKFGVEIYDISDISTPSLVTIIGGYNEEFYDCSVSGQYLYVSGWAESKISVFDIKTITSPVKVTEFNVGGRAAGTVIRDSFLYIATGYHSKDSSSNVASPGYGMGNGLDIYDISNPKAPSKVSSTKIDGRYFYSGFDHWNVEVSGNYAFFSNAYTGIHVIDISDPYAPKKLSNISVDIPASSKNYQTISSSTYVLPYDSKTVSRAIITSVAVTDGGIYFATNSGNSYYSGVDINNALGLYYQSIPGLIREEIAGGSCDYIVENKNTDDVEVSVEGATFRQMAKSEDIWSVFRYNDKYYCSTGKKEIVVLNSDYKVVERHETDGITKDAVVVKDVLYVAEGSEGLGAYKISGSSLKKIGSVNYDSYSTVFTTVNIINEYYLIAQISWTRYAVISILDPTKPLIIENVNAGSMYDRSLLGYSEDTEYQSVFGRNALVWYKANGKNRPKMIQKFSTTRYGEQNGIAYGNGYAVTIFNNGYIFYDPATITEEEYNKLPTVNVPGTKLRGMPYISGNIMFVSNCYGRTITIIDISDIKNPILLGELSVDGNPDEIYSDEYGKYIIPLRHDGIMEIKIN